MGREAITVADETAMGLSENAGREILRQYLNCGVKQLTGNPILLAQQQPTKYSRAAHMMSAATLRPRLTSLKEPVFGSVRVGTLEVGLFGNRPWPIASRRTHAGTHGVLFA